MSSTGFGWIWKSLRGFWRDDECVLNECWVNLDELEWIWLNLNGVDWLRVDLRRFEWMWMTSHGFEWLWMNLNGFEWRWMKLRGFDSSCIYFQLSFDWACTNSWIDLVCKFDWFWMDFKLSLIGLWIGLHAFQFISMTLQDFERILNGVWTDVRILNTCWTDSGLLLNEFWMDLNEFQWNWMTLNDFLWMWMTWNEVEWICLNLNI